MTLRFLQLRLSFPGLLPSDKIFLRITRDSVYRAIFEPFSVFLGIPVTSRRIMVRMPEACALHG